MGRGRHPLCIEFLESDHVLEDALEITLHGLGFIRRQRKPCEFGNVVDLLPGDPRHRAHRLAADDARQRIETTRGAPGSPRPARPNRECLEGRAGTTNPSRSRDVCAAAPRPVPSRAK